jgi:hypothetical protein
MLTVGLPILPALLHYTTLRTSFSIHIPGH